MIGGRTPDLKRYRIGERGPHAVHAPADAAGVAAVLRDCDAAGSAVVLFGGGTLQSLGHVPTRYDVALDLRRLDRILAYEPRERAIAVEAGVTLEVLAATLEAHGLFLPLDAPHTARATVGGTLASGWLGPRRAAYGAAREFVIGATVALADGTLATSGRIGNDASRDDVAQLTVGSLGTLAAILSANVTTLPLPEARRLVISPLPAGTRARTTARLRDLDIEPVAILALTGYREIAGVDGKDGRAFVLLEGSTRAVERATRDLRSALGAAGVPDAHVFDRDVPALFARALDAYVTPLGRRSIGYQSCGLPADAGRRRDAFERIARANRLAVETIEDLRTGDVVARLSARTLTDFASRALAFDDERRTELGRARVLFAGPDVRERVTAWGYDGTARSVTAEMKVRFDPRHTLAPGRLEDRIGSAAP